MIPLTFLYDEYIDLPKLFEQKKPLEYIIPPPTSGGTNSGTNRVKGHKSFQSIETNRDIHEALLRNFDVKVCEKI